MYTIYTRADYCSQIYYHDRLSIVDFAIAINYHDSFNSLQTTFFLIMVLSEQCRILPSSLNAISRYSVCPDLHEARPLSRIAAGCEYSGISYFQGQIACQNHQALIQNELLNYYFQISMISQPTIVLVHCMIIRSVSISSLNNGYQMDKLVPH